MRNILFLIGTLIFTTGCGVYSANKTITLKSPDEISSFTPVSFSAASLNATQMATLATNMTQIQYTKSGAAGTGPHSVSATVTLSGTNAGVFDAVYNFGGPNCDLTLGYMILYSQVQSLRTMVQSLLVQQPSGAVSTTATTEYLDIVIDNDPPVRIYLLPGNAPAGSNTTTDAASIIYFFNSPVFNTSMSC